MPLYPGATLGQGNYGAEIGDTRSGLATQTTADDFATVKQYYDQYLAREGFVIQSSAASSDNLNPGFLIAAEKGRISLGILIATGGQEITVTLTYQGPK